MARESKAMRRAGKYADDILEAIRTIERYTQHYDFKELFPADDADNLKVIVIERCLARLSEASDRLPESLKKAEQDINWQRIHALGNRLRHEYDQLDYDMLWEICTKYLPALKLAVERIKSRL